jgi:hypothetical protein
MAAAAVQRVMLSAHAREANDPVRSIAVDAQLASGRVLTCHYTLTGDLTRLRVPQVRAGERRDGLWQHTCFEAFIAAPGEPGYYEFNFSPSRDWAAYCFDDYRTNMTAATLQRAPDLEVHAGGERLELTARVPLAGLALLEGEVQLRLALAAVSEAASGPLTYWAAQHAPGQPDFHHPDGFVLELRSA